MDNDTGTLDRLAPFVKLAGEAEIRSRARANAARDRVSALRAQLADAEREMAEAVRESESDQTFLRDVWDHYRAEATR
jgi:hypothetical protein